MLWDIFRGAAAAAFVGAALLLLVPEGTGRRVLALGIGAAVTVCALSPLQGLRGEEIVRRLRTYAESFSQGEEEEEKSMQKEILCDQIAAYIETRAEELSVPCTAEVGLAADGDSFRVTWVTLRTKAEDPSALVAAMAAELGLSEENIQCLQN